MLEIKNLSKTFKNKEALKNINLTLQSGDIALLLGPSGVGKSTLLRILNNLEKPDTGSVFFEKNSIDLNTVHQKHLISMVFQQFSLFKHLNAQENLTIVLEKIMKLCPEDSIRAAETLLEKFNLIEQRNLPISKLSGGQQQRLAIARAITVNPKILCMDEPTSALDPKLTQHIAELIKTLAQEGYALLITTHDMSLVEKLNATLYLMDKGSFFESVNSSDFKKNPKIYPALNEFIYGNSDH